MLLDHHRHEGSLKSTRRRIRMGANATILLEAISSLLEEKGLVLELQVDSSSRDGRLIWKRQVMGIKRSLWISPIADSHHPNCQYYMHWWTEKVEGDSTEGNWVGTLQHTVEAFSRFLIEGEEWRAWHKYITQIYIEHCSSRTAEEEDMSKLPADASKIEAVRAYFEQKFPSHVISDPPETDTITEVFIVESPSADAKYKCKLSRKFLDDNSAPAIVAKLEHSKVAEYLTKNSPVMVNWDGKHAHKSMGAF